jgi:hypothetical protein
VASPPMISIEYVVSSALSRPQPANEFPEMERLPPVLRIAVSNPSKTMSRTSPPEGNQSATPEPTRCAARGTSDATTISAGTCRPSRLTGPLARRKDGCVVSSNVPAWRTIVRYRLEGGLAGAGCGVAPGGADVHVMLLGSVRGGVDGAGIVHCAARPGRGVRGRRSSTRSLAAARRRTSWAPSAGASSTGAELTGLCGATGAFVEVRNRSRFAPTTGAEHHGSKHRRPDTPTRQHAELLIQRWPLGNSRVPVRSREHGVDR